MLTVAFGAAVAARSTSKSCSSPGLWGRSLIPLEAILALAYSELRWCLKAAREALSASWGHAQGSTCRIFTACTPRLEGERGRLALCVMAWMSLTFEVLGISLRPPGF